MLEQIKDNLYKINKHQYLKVGKKGNGEIIAPIHDPVTNKFSYHNLIFTGGTVWGLIKVIIIITFLLFMLWRYQVETADCLRIRDNFDPRTGCVNDEYFYGSNINIKEEDNEGRLSLFTSTESNDKIFS